MGLGYNVRVVCCTHRLEGGCTKEGVVEGVAATKELIQKHRLAQKRETKQLC